MTHGVTDGGARADPRVHPTEVKPGVLETQKQSEGQRDQKTPYGKGGQGGAAVTSSQSGASPWQRQRDGGTRETSGAKRMTVQGGTEGERSQGGAN